MNSDLLGNDPEDYLRGYQERAAATANQPCTPSPLPSDEWWCYVHDHEPQWVRE